MEKGLRGEDTTIRLDRDLYLLVSVLKLPQELSQGFFLEEGFSTGDDEVGDGISLHLLLDLSDSLGNLHRLYPFGVVRGIRGIADRPSGEDTTEVTSIESYEDRRTAGPYPFPLDGRTEDLVYTDFCHRFICLSVCEVLQYLSL